MQYAAIDQTNATELAPASTSEEDVALPLREDTILGVCQAIGEDFGFNPTWLRVALGAGVLWNPWAMFAVYLGLGFVVLLSRLIFPRRRATAASLEAIEEAPAEGGNEERSELPLAA